MGLKTVYHTLPPDDVCFDVILSHSCYFPSTAYRHLHLRDLLDVGDHVCLQARSCLSTGWALNRCFAWFFGTVAVLAQGGGGVNREKSAHGAVCDC